MVSDQLSNDKAIMATIGGPDEDTPADPQPVSPGRAVVALNAGCRATCWPQAREVVAFLVVFDPLRKSSRDWVNAAFEAVGRSGLDAISVDALASELAVPDAEFYEHFDNRRALQNAVIDHWYAIATAYFERHVDISYPDDQMRAVAKTFLLDDQMRRADRWLLFHDPTDPGLAERTNQVRAETQSFAREQLKELGFDEEEAELRSHLLYTGYLGLLVEIESRTGPLDHDDICRKLDELVDMVTQ